MIRLLFLCLLLPAATALSDDMEGSGGEVSDDEDIPTLKREHDQIYGSARPSIHEKPSDQMTIIIVVAVVALTLSVAAIVTIMLVRRHMHRRQQGIYSVPTEQDKKGAV